MYIVSNVFYFYFLAHFGCYRYQSEVNSTIIRGIITSSMCLEVAQQQLLQLPLASSQYRDPCHGSDPNAAARFRTHFITLCFVYRVKVSNSTTSIPFDASWWLNDTDSSLQQFVNMRWYTIILYKYLQQPYEEMEIFQVVHIFTKEQWNIILHAQIIIYCLYYYL